MRRCWAKLTGTVCQYELATKDQEVRCQRHQLILRAFARMHSALDCYQCIATRICTVWMLLLDGKICKTLGALAHEQSDQVTGMFKRINEGAKLSRTSS